MNLPVGDLSSWGTGVNNFGAQLQVPAIAGGLIRSQAHQSCPHQTSINRRGDGGSEKSISRRRKVGGRRITARSEKFELLISVFMAVVHVVAALRKIVCHPRRHYLSLNC
ncbi:ubiquitin-fold modifier 1 [Striga asiatica]|uniref:Ubiquitin-fold modifier 1 n=1 Tax=Striga asiatica TaxID=4170 RepID=A0A5A7P042_STRAF|nr:ubiquitin-fold modifier 1 [Striga asiatica]